LIPGRIRGKIIGKSITAKNASLPFANAEIGESKVTALEIGKATIASEVRRRKKFPSRLKSA